MTKAFTLIRTVRKNLISVNGFTLIELLVVISIIGILIGLSVFGLQGARQSSRDARRKADLEQIRSGLEIYKADCGLYPSALSTSLTGACPGPTVNTYISSVPTDPADPTGITRKYYYKDYPTATTTYIICAALESPPSPLGDLDGCGNNCGSDTACNYKVKNP